MVFLLHIVVEGQFFWWDGIKRDFFGLLITPSWRRNYYSSPALMSVASIGAHTAKVMTC